ncbi:MAG: hypothetical protein Q8928_02010 [Bacteroidota bacterium]|nr:hypothetical protein [Bacteroidota bacterium]
MKNIAFTICAKNYLAQALTLKNSFKSHNPNIDFLIFLSDLKDAEGLPEVIELGEDWISNWKQMAFKYNVIEFSTSIKPFCFNKLFSDGYENVIYLDPDIYVTSSLKEIFEYLSNKSIILSPHYCEIETNYSGAVTEEELLFVGIYNLGFVAIKNDNIGKKIIEWWTNRLSTKCYADKFDALHVDQKWMDFIPAFFPDQTYITHHMGINPAIWNLHERELFISKDGYKIKNKVTNETFPLLFFHFSGFDPFNPKLVNRRHPKYNTENFPSFIPLFQEYIENEYKNGYEYYSKLTYSFNSYKDGERILPFHRRLFRILEKQYNKDNPFDQNGSFKKTLKKNKLLAGIKTADLSVFSDKERQKKSKLEKCLIFLMKILKQLVGIRYYAAFLEHIQTNSRIEKQTFLLK